MDVTGVIALCCAQHATTTDPAGVKL